ncbi:MAG: phosphate signaling complex protein PhoU [Acholeplasmatales bacterium]|nr:phosphate signaling complex protein PhoU [Acholeplasmatales bacterium]
MTLQNELEYLNQTLFKMSDVVVENINEAINYYLGKTDSVNVNDDLVDQYERLVEEICLSILLRERPYARDLKEVTGILKLVADIERIGDHAEDIYDFAKKVKHYNHERNAKVDELVKFINTMLKDAVTAYITKDLNLANDVINRDDYVDSKYEEIISDLANSNINDSSDLPFAIYTTLVVKYLERIADHSVNVAEWVIYIINGFHKDKKIF